MSRLPLLSFTQHAHLYVMENNKQLQQELNTSLTNVYHEYISTLGKFTDAQINEIPFEGSWTPGQVTDHIIKATGGIPDKHTAPAKRPYDEKVGKMESVFLDFETKFKSPEFVVPGSGPFHKQVLIETLRSTLQRHVAKIDGTDLTELCLKFELPSIGTMTRYEWFRFIIAHMIRHHGQLKNILNSMTEAKSF
jgi:hypothetical protein